MRWWHWKFGPWEWSHWNSSHLARVFNPNPHGPLSRTEERSCTLHLWLSPVPALSWMAGPSEHRYSDHWALPHLLAPPQPHTDPTILFPEGNTSSTYSMSDIEDDLLSSIDFFPVFSCAVKTNNIYGYSSLAYTQIILKESKQPIFLILTVIQQ